MIWNEVADGKYRCTVTQTGDGYQGLLRITHIETDLVIHEQEVGVSYGAPFGPDFEDVAEWTGICLDTIDSLKK